MRRGLANGWFALRTELTKSKRGVPKPELRDLTQTRAQLVQSMRVLQPPNGFELRVGSSARAHEVRMIRIRQPVRARPGRPDHRPFLQRQRGVARPRRRQGSCDPVDPLRVREPAIAAGADLQLRYLGDGLRPGPALAPHLEVRR